MPVLGPRRRNGGTSLKPISNGGNVTCHAATRSIADALPPAWRAFMDYCRELGHGQIERLSIQDGLPVLAEVTKQKIKFTK